MSAAPPISSGFLRQREGQGDDKQAANKVPQGEGAGDGESARNTVEVVVPAATESETTTAPESGAYVEAAPATRPHPVGMLRTDVDATSATSSSSEHQKRGEKIVVEKKPLYRHPHHGEQQQQEYLRCQHQNGKATNRTSSSRPAGPNSLDDVHVSTTPALADGREQAVASPSLGTSTTSTTRGGRLALTARRSTSDKKNTARPDDDEPSSTTPAGPADLYHGKIVRFIGSKGVGFITPSQSLSYLDGSKDVQFYIGIGDGGTSGGGNQFLPITLYENDEGVSKIECLKTTLLEREHEREGWRAAG